MVIITLLSGCASSDHRLEGRWKSNKELTLATIKLRDPVTATKRATLDSIFGKLVMCYDRTHVIAELPASNGRPGWHSRTRYRVVASDNDSLAYISTDVFTGEPEISHVYFESPDRYWIYLNDTGSKEYFDRINPE